MRLVFMGTPSFAVPVLEALFQSPHDVVGVYTQPDRSAGRGKRLLATPVKEAALRYGVPLFQPASLRSREAQEGLAALSPEAIVVAAYGRYLPPEVFNLPAKGCLNLHPSLLPKYRGASPVASAVSTSSRPWISCRNSISFSGAAAPAPRHADCSSRVSGAQRERISKSRSPTRTWPTGSDMTRVLDPQREGSPTSVTWCRRDSRSRCGCGRFGGRMSASRLRTLVGGRSCKSSAWVSSGNTSPR